jgi:hypothetical protein
MSDNCFLKTTKLKLFYNIFSCVFCDYRPDKKHWLDPTTYRVSIQDVGFVVVFAVLLTFLRYRIQALSIAWAKRLKVADPHKFSESIWKTLFYVTSFSWGFGLVAVRNFVWMYDYDAVFRDVPASYASGSVDTDLRFFYIFQIGFYTHSIYAHLLIETRRKDFWQMLIHHVATFMLVSISFTTRFLEIGTLIVALHDFSDILFEIAKLYVYMKNDFMANVWFALWVLSWIVLRLMYYPYWIVRGSVYESVGHLGHYPHYATCAAVNNYNNNNNNNNKRAP